MRTIRNIVAFMFAIGVLVQYGSTVRAGDYYFPVCNSIYEDAYYGYAQVSDCGPYAGQGVGCMDVQNDCASFCASYNWWWGDVTSCTEYPYGDPSDGLYKIYDVSCQCR